MDFYADLIKITEFQPLEEYLIKKRSSEIANSSKSNKITVSINPSNLVELTRVGERYAPDSCVDKGHFKYVVTEKFIPNQPVPTHLQRNEVEASVFKEIETRAHVKPIIPSMIVRERPGITYKPLKEASFISEPSVTETFPQKSPKILSTYKTKEIPASEEKTVKMPLKTQKKAKSSKKIKTILRNKSNKPKEENLTQSISDRKTVT